MLRFFRQIRQKLFTENRFRKYLLYAVGEIVLIVLGIWIALQLNNWNEERKTKAEIKSIFARVLTELENNIKESTDLFRFMYETDSLSFLLLQSKLSKEDITLDYLSDSHPIIELNTAFRTLSLTQNSFNQLVGNIDNIPDEYMYVVDELVLLYETRKRKILSRQNLLLHDERENMRERTKLPFYTNKYELLLNDNEDYFDYVLKNTEFKGQINIHLQLYYSQLEKASSFRTQAIKCQRLISSILKLDDRGFKWNTDSRTKRIFEGKYLTFWGDTVMCYVKNDLPYQIWQYGTQDEHQMMVHHFEDLKFFDVDLYQRYVTKEDSVLIFTNRFPDKPMAIKILD